jgi:hypothetical protein
MQVRYQAALRPDKPNIIPEKAGIQSCSISIIDFNSPRKPPGIFPVSGISTAATSTAPPSSRRLRAPLMVKPWL